MTTETPKADPAAPAVEEPAKRSWLGPAISVAALVAVAVFFGVNARKGPGSPRIDNPEVEGAPRPVEVLFGWSTSTWVVILEAFTIVTMAVIIVLWVVHWRRNPHNPTLLMALVTSLIVWQDPLMNWSPFAVYNPELAHLPEDWPLVSVSPTVEPFVVLGYVMFYLGPYFPAIWILRKLQARRPVDSFVWRHPLISLAAIIFPIGVIVDAALEITLVRTGMYIYSQVPPWASVFTGQPHQFPLIWEVVAVTFVMIPAGVLLYRDDTGKSVAEKLAQRARIFASRPRLGTFVVMFVIINIAYFCYGGLFAIVKATKISTSVACSWPYPEVKVYDPQGFYEENGQVGPYSVGIMSTWMSGQPDGRPDVELGAKSDRCAPENANG
ncbi:membrane protein [Mycolicibacterium elephantis]|uniref:spirocyclase AveC family protein n=1 Tax=Mycolicibacterium elephantis TaxID=81858 RepID=UPI0006299542|nr:spirocyclase AveC family protein [Mycolicibacterium elephantis]KKW64616.1 membrane protein [Mycolicibacterium elephantis]